MKAEDIFNLILTIPLEQSEMGNWGYKKTEVMRVANEILALRKEKTDEQKQIEDNYLELFNRIKKDFHQKRGKRCTPTRTLSKPAQLHTALKIYSMDELGKVILGVFGDKFHQDKNWVYSTTEYCCRQTTIEKYL